jgi:hypothetical protein
VTARIPISSPAACAAAASIAGPPAAWTVSHRTAVLRRRAPTALPTVLGMSWSFRSRKIGA